MKLPQVEATKLAIVYTRKMISVKDLLIIIWINLGRRKARISRPR